MLRVVNLIAIRDCSALVVCSPEGDWNFSGGKADVNESLEDALRRELKEELPDLKISRLVPYKMFNSVTPNSQQPVEISTFFGDIYGSTQPSAEVIASAWVKTPTVVRLTDGSKKIWVELVKDGHLSG